MSNKKKGVLFILCSAFCFALMNLFVKLSGDLPSMQKSFFRNFVAMIFAFIILMRSGRLYAEQAVAIFRNFNFLSLSEGKGHSGTGRCCVPRLYRRPVYYQAGFCRLWPDLHLYYWRLWRRLRRTAMPKRQYKSSNSHCRYRDASNHKSANGSMGLPVSLRNGK